jgi:hypothetical protein
MRLLLITRKIKTFVSPPAEKICRGYETTQKGRRATLGVMYTGEI